MYRNRSASVGLAGSDPVNPLPATTTPSTSRTYNQAQQPPFPPGTAVAAAAAAAAATAIRDDHPHLAGNEACLCPSCHLKDNYFPRSQDGRIVLPHPSLSIHSARLPITGSTTTFTTNAATTATTTSGHGTRKRVRADSTASNSDLRLSVAKFNQGRRRGGGSRTPLLQSDKGEGSSTGVGRTSSNVEESWMTLPQSSSREVISTDESQHTRRSKHGASHSFSGFSKRSRSSAKTERPDPWPRIIEPEELPGQPSPITQQSSQQSQPMTLNTKSRLEILLENLGTSHHSQSDLQPLQARESSPRMSMRGTFRSGAPSTASQSHTGAYDHGHGHSIPSSLRDEMGPSMLSYPEPTGRLETSYHRHRHHHHDSVETPTEAAQDKPNIIRFSSRSENPQPSNNPEATTATTGEENVRSSPITRDPPPPPPPSSSSSHQLQPPFEISNNSSSSNVQTQFRFQEPVVPEPLNTSPIATRDLSIVQVKWDSERKRRQGYFAQEEGSEKSPFRHYNKANCDFES